MGYCSSGEHEQPQIGTGRMMIKVAGLETKTALFLRASIDRWLSEDQPGVVACNFVDRLGKRWHIEEKLAVVTNEDAWGPDALAVPAYIACTLIAEALDDLGRPIATISTIEPWDIETTDGQSEFEVFRDQLLEALPEPPSV